MELYRHNQAAYEAALALLDQTGKAAIIHPTGTGKSFIAFKLCEEHPDDAVCWLFPSEYIFRTQTENSMGALQYPLFHVHEANAYEGNKDYSNSAALHRIG